MTRLSTMVSSILSDSRRSANISVSHVISGLHGDKANEKCNYAPKVQCLRKESEIMLSVNHKLWGRIDVYPETYRTTAPNNEPVMDGRITLLEKGKEIKFVHKRPNGGTCEPCF